MVRVLQVYPQLNNAGTERVIFNLYENVDRSMVQFDFLVEKKGELDEKVIDMGGRIYYLYAKKRKDYYAKLLSFFDNHPEYIIVHTHTHARMDIVLKAAKKAGITCRIAHSHNARNDLPKIASFVKGLTSIPMECSATHFFACSRNAAKWLFPHRVNKCQVLYNGINLNTYLYDESNRIEMRKQLEIDDETFVMIHVGRFAKQKNHEYLIKVLNAYNAKSEKNWKMLLVGVGPLQDEIKKQVIDKGIEEQVLFLNNRNDVNKLLSAADMFVFPSLHEGLGIVAIEAQASGVPCIVSDAVPIEADIGIGLLHTLKLADEPDKWAFVIEENKCKNVSREDNKDRILASNYNIKNIGTKMQQFYLENGR